MTTVTMSRRPGTGVPWGVYVFVGALWLILGWIVLRFNSVAVGAIALLAGLVVLGVAVFEFFDAIAAPGWRWLHLLLAVLFAAFAIVIMINPGASFVWIAAFVAFYLLIAGFFNIVMAFASSRDNDAWWLLLIVGIVQMMVGFWAAGSWARSAALLIIVVGAVAIFRGITSIVAGFQIRKIEQVRREAGTASFATVPATVSPTGRHSGGEAGTGRATPGTPPSGQATPGTPPGGQATPGTPPGGQATPAAPPSGQTTPAAPPSGQTMPGTSGPGRAGTGPVNPSTTARHTYGDTKPDQQAGPRPAEGQQGRGGPDGEGHRTG